MAAQNTRNMSLTAKKRDVSLTVPARPIKVLQLATIDIALKNLLLPLLQALRDDGFEVEAAAKMVSEETITKIERAGIRFHNIEIERNIHPMNLLRASMSIYSLLNENSYDILHLHTPVASFLGRIIGKIKHIPCIIYTAHGFYFHDNMRFEKKFLFKTMENLACRAATDYLFCQSIEDTMTAIKEKFASPERIVHIGNGVNLDRFKPDIETSSIIRRELALPPDAVVITFIGRMVKEKGVIELLEAFQIVSDAFPNAHLLLVGDSKKAKDRDTETEMKLREMISMGSMGERVILSGFVEKPEELLSASDIFVLPSHREGLPRTICEAMACGLPVIATDIRGPREQIVEGQTGFLVPVRSPEILAERMIQLIKLRGLRISMGERARKAAEKNFDERKVIETQMRVYRIIRETMLSE